MATTFTAVEPYAHLCEPMPRSKKKTKSERAGPRKRRPKNKTSHGTPPWEAPPNKHSEAHTGNNTRQKGGVHSDGLKGGIVSTIPTRREDVQADKQKLRSATSEPADKFPVRPCKGDQRSRRRPRKRTSNNGVSSPNHSHVEAVPPPLPSRVIDDEYRCAPAKMRSILPIANISSEHVQRVVALGSHGGTIMRAPTPRQSVVATVETPRPTQSPLPPVAYACEVAPFITDAAQDCHATPAPWTRHASPLDDLTFLSHASCGPLSPPTSSLNEGLIDPQDTLSPARVLIPGDLAQDIDYDSAAGRRTPGIHEESRRLHSHGGDAIQEESHSWRNYDNVSAGMTDKVGLHIDGATPGRSFTVTAEQWEQSSYVDRTFTGNQSTSSRWLVADNIQVHRGCRSQAFARPNRSNCIHSIVDREIHTWKKQHQRQDNDCCRRYDSEATRDESEGITHASQQTAKDGSFASGRQRHAGDGGSRVLPSAHVVKLSPSPDCPPHPSLSSLRMSSKFCLATRLTSPASSSSTSCFCHLSRTSASCPSHSSSVSSPVSSSSHTSSYCSCGKCSSCGEAMERETLLPCGDVAESNVSMDLRFPSPVQSGNSARICLPSAPYPPYTAYTPGQRQGSHLAKSITGTLGAAATPSIVNAINSSNMYIVPAFPMASAGYHIDAMGELWQEGLEQTARAEMTLPVASEGVHPPRGTLPASSFEGLGTYDRQGHVLAQSLLLPPRPAASASGHVLAHRSALTGPVRPSEAREAAVSVPTVPAMGPAYLNTISSLDVEEQEQRERQYWRRWAIWAAEMERARRLKEMKEMEQEEERERKANQAWAESAVEEERQNVLREIFLNSMTTSALFLSGTSSFEDNYEIICPYLGCVHSCMRHQLSEHLLECPFAYHEDELHTPRRGGSGSGGGNTEAAADASAPEASPSSVDISDYIVVCPYAILGCKVTCLRSRIQSHLEQCPFQGRQEEENEGERRQKNREQVLAQVERERLRQMQLMHDEFEGAIFEDEEDEEGDERVLTKPIGAEKFTKGAEKGQEAAEKDTRPERNKSQRRRRRQRALQKLWEEQVRVCCEALTLEMEGFSKQCLAHTESERTAREGVVGLVKEVVDEIWPGASVDLYGSFATGLTIDSSDVDLVVCLKDNWIERKGADGEPKLLPLANALEQFENVLRLDRIETGMLPLIKLKMWWKKGVARAAGDGPCGVGQRPRESKLANTVNHQPQETQKGGNECKGYHCDDFSVTDTTMSGDTSVARHSERRYDETKNSSNILQKRFNTSPFKTSSFSSTLNSATVAASVPSQPSTIRESFSSLSCSSGDSSRSLLASSSKPGASLPPDRPTLRGGGAVKVEEKLDAATGMVIRRRRSSVGRKRLNFQPTRASKPITGATEAARAATHPSEDRVVVSVDISLDAPSHSGIATAGFIEHLVQRFPQLPPLVQVIKKFLRQRELNEAFTGGLSSYAIVIMAAFVILRHCSYKPSSSSVSGSREKKAHESTDCSSHSPVTLNRDAINAQQGQPEETVRNLVHQQQLDGKVDLHPIEKPVTICTSQGHGTTQASAHSASVFGESLLHPIAGLSTSDEGSYSTTVDKQCDTTPNVLPATNSTRRRRTSAYGDVSAYESAVPWSSAIPGAPAGSSTGSENAKTNCTVLTASTEGLQSETHQGEAATSQVWRHSHTTRGGTSVQSSASTKVEGDAREVTVGLVERRRATFDVLPWYQRRSPSVLSGKGVDALERAMRESSLGYEGASPVNSLCPIPDPHAFSPIPMSALNAPPPPPTTLLYSARQRKSDSGLYTSAGMSRVKKALGSKTQREFGRRVSRALLSHLPASSSTMTERSASEHSAERAEDGRCKDAKDDSLLGQLFMEFLWFFGAEFQPSCEGISLRNGGYRFDISTSPFAGSGAPLMLEDPLNIFNNVGRGCFRSAQVFGAFGDALSSLSSIIARGNIVSRPKNRRQGSDDGRESSCSVEGANNQCFSNSAEILECVHNGRNSLRDDDPGGERSGLDIDYLPCQSGKGKTDTRAGPERLAHFSGRETLKTSSRHGILQRLMQSDSKNQRS